jgi:uncharacterized protein YbcI
MPDDGAGLQAAEQEDARPVLLELSNEMVRLYKTLFGRGPTKTRSHWLGADAVATTLEDTFTPAERNMVELGEHARLRDMRTFFQHASAKEFREAAERVTGRKVRGFVSGVDTEVDIATEVFYFEPEA